MCDIFKLEDDYYFEDLGVQDVTLPTDKTDAVLSVKDCPVKPAEEVINPLPKVAHLGPYLLETLPSVPERCVFEREDLYSPHFDDIAQGFKSLLAYAYNVVPVLEKQHAISLAVVTPLIGFIDNEVAKRPGVLDVLILGAGEGKDIRRLRESGISANIVCVEPSESRCKALESVYDVKPICSTFSAAIPLLMKHTFDVVISNMSVHYILGVDSGYLLPQYLNTNLKQGGVFYGSFFDVETIKAVNLAKTTQYGHSIMYLGDDPKGVTYGERVTRSLARVSVSGRVFCDPVVEVADVYKLFSLASDISCNLYTGDEVVRGATERGALYPVSNKFKDAVSRTELGLLRVIVAYKGKATHPGSLGFAPTPHIMQAQSIDGISMIASGIQYNKGKPAIHSDLLYFDAGTSWVAEKLDGVMAKVVHKQGALRVVIEDGTIMKFKGYNGACPQSFILQAEVIGQRVIITDILVPPWGQTGSFYSRWSWLVRLCQIYSFPFELQTWVENLPTPALLDLVINASEGLVFQSILAPPGFVRGGSGSARYIKRIYTIDRRQPDGTIAEYTVDGSFVRTRSDKHLPNTELQVKRICKAIKYEEFLSHLFVRYVGVPGATWVRMLQLVENFVPPNDWSDADLLLFYVYRESPVLKLAMKLTTPEYVMSVLRAIESRAHIIAPEVNVDLPPDQGLTEIDYWELEHGMTHPSRYETHVPIKAAPPVEKVPLVCSLARPPIGASKHLKSSWDDVLNFCDRSKVPLLRSFIKPIDQAILGLYPLESAESSDE